MQVFRLEKGSALTHQEGDDNNRFPHLWDTTKTFEKDVVVFDGSDFYYLCIQAVTVASTIPLTNTSYWKKLSQTTSVSLNSLTDVVLTTPVTGQGLIYNGTNWVNNSGSSIIDVTYTQLTTLISSSGVLPGVYYRLEYQNKHTIPGTSDNHTGPIENLLLLGITTTKVSKEAFSESFPNDSIHYDVSNSVCEDGTTTRTGYIERRISHDNSISTPFDFRNTKVRRYKQNNPNWTTTNAYSKGTVVLNSGSLFGCVVAHTSGTSFATDKGNYWCRIYAISSNYWGEYTTPASISLLSGANLGGFNILYDVTNSNDYNVFEDLTNTYNVFIGDNLGFAMGDIIVGSGVNGLEIGSGCKGIMIGRNSKDCKVSATSVFIYLDNNNTNTKISSSNRISIGQYSVNNEICDNSSTIAIATYCQNNKVTSSSGSSMSESSTKNRIDQTVNSYLLQNSEDNYIQDSTACGIGIGSRHNELKIAVTCSIGDTSIRNRIIDSSTITIGANSNYNSVLSTITATLGSYQNNNTLRLAPNAITGTQCSENEIENSSTVVLGANCENNKITSLSNTTELKDGCDNILVRGVTGTVVPAGSNSCKFEDSGSITFSSLTTPAFGVSMQSVGNVTIGANANTIQITSGSGSIVIGDQCKEIYINASGALVIGNSNNDVRISNCGNLTIGNSNKNLLLQNSIQSTIGNSNIGLELSSDINSSILTSNIELKLEKCTNLTILNGNESSSFSNCLTCTILNTNKNLSISSSNNVTVQGSSNSCTVSESAVVTVGIGAEACTVNKNCSAVVVPNGALNSTFSECDNITVGGAPTMLNCDFKSMSTCAINSNLDNLTTLAPVENKTFSAAFQNVIISVKSVSVETLNVAKSDRHYNSVSPNGQIWSIATDNVGNITNESLS